MKENFKVKLFQVCFRDQLYCRTNYMRKTSSLESQDFLKGALWLTNNWNTRVIYVSKLRHIWGNMGIAIAC